MIIAYTSRRKADLPPSISAVWNCLSSLGMMIIAYLPERLANFLAGISAVYSRFSSLYVTIFARMPEGLAKSRMSKHLSHNDRIDLHSLGNRMAAGMPLRKTMLGRSKTTMLQWSKGGYVFPRDSTILISRGDDSCIRAVEKDRWFNVTLNHVIPIPFDYANGARSLQVSQGENSRVDISERDEVSRSQKCPYHLHRKSVLCGLGLSRWSECEDSRTMGSAKIDSSIPETSMLHGSKLSVSAVHDGFQCYRYDNSCIAVSERDDFLDHMDLFHVVSR